MFANPWHYAQWQMKEANLFSTIFLWIDCMFDIRLKEAGMIALCRAMGQYDLG
jgi:hypothetical protein